MNLHSLRSQLIYECSKDNNCQNLLSQNGFVIKKRIPFRCDRFVFNKKEIKMMSKASLSDFLLGVMPTLNRRASMENHSLLWGIQQVRLYV